MAYIDLNEKLSVDLNNGQFVERTDILTEYNDKLKIYQSTTHEDNGQNFAWIKLAPRCSFDIYFVADSEKYLDYICVFEGYYEKWEHAIGGTYDTHYGGYNNYRYLGNWKKMKISNRSGEDKYYTVIWRKVGSVNKYEDIGLFAINITNKTIEPSPIIELNDNISLDLGGGQFVERTDILTEYSDKLKIYQSTSHVDNGQSYAWIKVAPHCSYDLYLIANSEVTFDYISIFEGYVDVWEYGSGGYVIRHEGGDVDYTKLYNWDRVQISNDTDEYKYYTVIWAKNSTDNANEDIGLFAINITSETIVSLPEIELNENISVDLNNGQFVERTDIMTGYSDKLKIYQSTAHVDNGQSYAWIKLSPNCSYDLYLIANSQANSDYICIFEGKLETWTGGYITKHDGGNLSYRYLGNWTKTQISNNTDADKYYTVIWRKNGSASYFEDIGLFAINITTETIVPEIDLSLINLNDNISVDLGDGQFVERTDIFTKYSDKLKIYQSTSHRYEARNFAWIKLAPHCSYDFYLVADSEYGNDFIYIFDGYVETLKHGAGGYSMVHYGGDVDYINLNNWYKRKISNETDEDKYYTVIWAKNSTNSKNEDIGMFAINITTETIVPSPIINLNDNISLNLNDGQFVERTDILTEYSDKLKIYQSTTHDDNGQNFAWIKLAPHCSYDLYLIADSQKYDDYICIFEGYLETWQHHSGGYVIQHAGGDVNYSFLGNWTKIQISNNNTNEYKYYTVIWSKDGVGNSNEDIGLFAINITTEPIVPKLDLPFIDLNENISVALNDGQFVERTDILTEYNDKLKIYQSTTHEDNGQNFAWIKLAPHCSYDIYLIANSQKYNDYIYIFEGYVETWTDNYFNQNYGGYTNYKFLGNWTKIQISNDTDEYKYYTVIWRKDRFSSLNEDIGMFAINITTETIVPEINSPLIALNENISVALNDGQFVERTDILTEYNDKLKIYQSTTHEDWGQNFAWIKLAPHCSYDIYLIANSEQSYDCIYIYEGYLETWTRGNTDYDLQHNGGYTDYTFLSNWAKGRINNWTPQDKYYTVIWSKSDDVYYEDIGMFAINTTNEILFIPPSNVLFQDGKRLFYLGNEFVRHIKYNDVNVNNIGTLAEYTNSYGVWSTIESWWGRFHSLLEQWNIMRPVWCKSNTFTDSNSLSISFNIFYREGLAEYAPITGSQVNAILSVYDAYGNRISKQEKQIPRSNENGITEEENTSLSLGFTVINNVGLYVPNTMTQTRAAFNNFPDLYKVTFDDVTIPSGGRYEIFFTTVNNPDNSWIIWDTNVKENIL